MYFSNYLNLSDQREPKFGLLFRQNLKQVNIGQCGRNLLIFSKVFSFCTKFFFFLEQLRNCQYCACGHFLRCELQWKIFILKFCQKITSMESNNTAPHFSETDTQRQNVAHWVWLQDSTWNSPKQPTPFELRKPIFNTWMAWPPSHFKNY